MDVRKLVAGAMLLSLFTLLNACAKNATDQTVGYLSSSAQCQPDEVKNGYVVKWKDGDVTLESYDSIAQMHADLDEISDYIDYVEKDHFVKISGGTPALQAAPTIDWGQDIVQAPSVWAQGIKGSGVAVAVVDTGVDITHPQLAGQIAINTAEQNGRTGIDDDGNGYIDDIYGYRFQPSADGKSIVGSTDVTDHNGHGSHVSGIIAADPSAGVIKGMAPQAKIIAAPFMDSSGQGSLGAAAAAILYATSRGAKVINASWGGTSCSLSLESTIANLEGQGVMFVVASGNDGVNLNIDPAFPAAFGLPGQITVGASGTSDFMAYFSNFSTSLVHLLAPGMSIYSTVPTAVNAAGYEAMDGTSMATPFVAGAVALLMGDQPSASIAQVKAALIGSVDHGNFPVISSGRMNIAKAVTLLRQQISSAPVSPLAP